MAAAGLRVPETAARKMLSANAEETGSYGLTRRGHAGWLTAIGA